jgi:2-phosphosulfolactate phosphatase
VYSQSPYVCRVEWGLRGAREAAERGDITVIVDVLSFSSTVVTAFHFAPWIFLHRRPGTTSGTVCEKTKSRPRRGPKRGRRTGRPLLIPRFPERSGVFRGRRKGVRPVGRSLLNVSAVDDAAERIHARTGADITVVPCGEQWADAREGENRLRPGIEDDLGAGAILSRLRRSLSPEARVFMGAFRSVRNSLAELIWDCAGGRELRLRGFAEDVRFCARMDAFGEVPLLQGDRFVDVSRAWKPDGDPPAAGRDFK